MSEFDKIEECVGWQKKIDSDSGDIYWMNIESGDVSYSAPQEVIDYVKLNKQQNFPTNLTMGISEQPITKKWEKIYDENSKKYKYVEKNTGEIYWNRPPEYVSVSNEKELEEQKNSIEDYKDSRDIGLSFSEDKKNSSVLDQLINIMRQPTQNVEESVPTSPDSELNFKFLDNELLTQIEDKDFWQFVEGYVVKRKKWTGSVIPYEKLLSFSIKLEHPLTKLSSNLEKNAFQSFKNILSYCQDRASSKAPDSHIYKILKNGFGFSAEVRDELYLLCIKQIRNNPNREKMVQVWKLLAVLSSSFSPSGTAVYAILNWLKSIGINTTDTTEEHYAKFCFCRVNRAFEDEPRNFLPTKTEIEYVINLKQIPVSIYFMNGTHTTVFIESYTSIKDLRDITLKKMQVSKERSLFYGVYEVCEKKDVFEERYYENEVKIVDILANWENEKEKILKEEQLNIDFKLYIKVRVYFPLIENDIDSVTMYFTQMLYEYQKSRFIATEEDIIELASLAIQHDHGDCKGNPQYLEDKYQNYIPIDHIKDNTQEDWILKILGKHVKLQGLSKHDARLRFLNAMKKWDLYLGQQYYCTQQKRQESVQKTELPDEVIICIKPESILICNAESKSTLMKIDYKKNLINWGVSADIFVLVVGNEESQEKIYFETPQGRSIDFLIQSYINLNMGKKPVETTVKLTRGSQSKDKKHKKAVSVFKKPYIV